MYIIKIAKWILKKIFNKWIKYDEMKKTISYLEPRLDIRSGIVNKIKNNKSWLRGFQYNKDKEDFQKYLNTLNASDLPKAEGVLREIQLKALNLAESVVRMLEQKGINPILTGGCLIGAVRHRGFVPWDDDIDFELMAEDYNKLPLIFSEESYIEIDTNDIVSYKDCYLKVDKALKENLNKYVFVKKPSCTSVFMGNSLEDCVVVEFFPRYFINENCSKEEYQKYCNRKHSEFCSLKNWNEIFKFFENELCNTDIYCDKSNITAMGWGNTSFNDIKKLSYIDISYIEPLVRIKFEDIEFYTYKEYDKYLTEFYKNYLSIPTIIKFGAYIESFSDILADNGRQYCINNKLKGN